MTIGQQIKLARELKGIQLVEVSQQLRVAVKVLESIEQDVQPKGVPNTIYQGFIRSYCKYLNIKPTPVTTEVIVEVDMPINKPEVQFTKPELQVEKPITTPEVQKKITENKLKNNDSYHEEIKSSPWSWGLIVGLLLVTAIGLKMYQRYQSEVYQPQSAGLEVKGDVPQLDPLLEQVVEASNPEQIEQPRSELSTEVAQTSAELIETPAAIPPVEEVAVAKNEINDKKPITLKAAGKAFNEVIIEAKKESQVKLSTGLKQTEAKMMLPGRFYVFREKGTFKLEATDSSGIVVTLNGRIIHQPNNEPSPLKIEVKE